MRLFQHIHTLFVLFAFSFTLLSCGGGSDSSSNGGFTLNGTISTSIFYAVDGDVNDPNAAFTPNDSLVDAQQLFFPVTLAGYLNFAGQGETGRSFAMGDTQDYYRIELSADDSIFLYIAAPQSTDVDLFLYRSDNFALVDASIGSGSTEFLSAPDDGEYIIEVRAVSDAQPPAGASNYNLIVADAESSSDSNGFRLSQEFIPGEIILRYNDEHLSASSFRSLHRLGEALGLEHRRGEYGREMLYSFKHGSGAKSAFRALNLPSSFQNRVVAGFVSDEMQYKLDTLSVIKQLKKRKDLRAVSPNFVRRSCRVPNDLYFNLQWHYDMIHLPEAWEFLTESRDVVVAVVDTGVLFGHPDLSPVLTSTGYDFVSSSSLEGNEPESEKGGIDPNPEDPGDEITGGSSFHGSHVAGTIAAATDNQIGVAGVSWNTARIMPLRALGLGGQGTSYDVLQAVRYAAGLPNDSGTIPPRRADIINLSVGGEGYWSEAQTLYREVSESGIIVVAAAGNRGTDEKSYPAAYEGVFSVSAVDFSSNLAYYSNFGETIDIAAPGGDSTSDLNSDGYPDGVLSTVGDDTSGSVVLGYGFSQGTSMAAPHLAGVAALMKSVWPEMTYNDFYGLLRSGQLTTDFGSTGKDIYYGYGLINAQKALLAAQGGVIPTAAIVNPTNIHFGAVLSTKTLWIEKTGEPTADLSVTSVEPDVDWIQVEPLQVDAFGLGSYTVSAIRTGLEEGSYFGTIEITTTENNPSVSVSLQVVQLERKVSAGYHYVLLLDPSTYGSLQQAEAEVKDGVYQFSFSGVRRGEYILVAGSDMDNDSIIGDLGNAIGAYLSTDQPVVLQVDQDFDDLNFKTEFNMQLSDNGVFGSGSHPSFERIVDEKGVKSIQ